MPIQAPQKKCQYISIQIQRSNNNNSSTNKINKSQYKVINFGIIDHYKPWISKHFNMTSTSKKGTIYDLRQC